MAKIKGVPVRKLFSDSESGYKIYAFDVVESNSDIEYNKYGNISVKGEFFDFDIGQEYDITVRKDSKGGYSGSYDLMSVERELPETYEDKLNFLSFSISDKQAEELLSEYPDVIEMIKEDRYDEIDVSKLFNIGEKTLSKIKDKVFDSFCIIDLVVRFADYGLSHTQISNLVKTYGSTEKIIFQMENNPYKLLCGVSGIGFKMADSKILKANPSLKSSYQRLGEAIIYIINNSDGDSAIKEDALANKLSGIDYSLRKMLISSIENGSINDIDNIMYYNGYITTERLFHMAKYVFKKLLMMSKLDNINKFELDIEDYRQLSDEIKLIDKQLGTIDMMNENNFGMLVGSAGCVDCDTEYFNGTEWKKISEYTDGELVLQYNDDRTANLVKPQEYHEYDLNGEKLNFIQTASNNVNQVLSDNHNFVYLTSKDNINKKPFHKVAEMHNKSKRGFYGRILNHFDYSGSGIDLSEPEIRLMIAILADGSLYSKRDGVYHRCRFNIKKQRKKERLVKLFKDNDLGYRVRKSSAEGYHEYYIQIELPHKEYPKEWYKCSKEQMEIIADEVLFWDGSVGKNDGSQRWFTCIKSDADFIQFVFSSLGYVAKVHTMDRTGEEYLTAGKIYIRQSVEYMVRITQNRYGTTSMTAGADGYKIDIKKYTPPDNKKYCFTVDSGMLVLRRDGRIFITGNSGKSSSIKSYIRFLKDNNMSFKISAFTGRASKVIAEHTGEEATTIHRMLKYHPQLGWRINEVNPLMCDVLIIDEVSMASIDIMYRVMKGVDINRTKILLIADSAQIPSISHGNVLHDLVQSKLFPINRLTKVFRYGDGGLARIATDTRNGKAWIDKDIGEVAIYGDNQDMVYIPKNGNVGLKVLIKMYKNLIDKYGIDNVVATTLYNKGKHGTERINATLQKVLNPPSKDLSELEHWNRTFRVRDKVMNIENRYGAEYIPNGIDTSNTYDDGDIKFLMIKDGSDKDVYNGDIGKIIYVTNKYVVVDFDGTHFVYSKSTLPALTHGYIISTFRLQGSESKYVLAFYPSTQTFLMNRNLLYVGLTRAKTKGVLIAPKKIINNALHQAAQFNRVTNMRNIIELFKERKRQNKED